MKSRNTKQREFILDCLEENKNRHLSIQDIEVLLREKDLSVSTTTIYRQLSKLVELNLVRKFKIDGQNSACYQFIEDKDICSHHFHMICSSCSKVVHFKNNKLDSLFDAINTSNKFKIDIPKSIFYGYCEKCAESII